MRGNAAAVPNRARDGDEEARRLNEEIHCEFKNLLMIISSNAEIMERRTVDRNVRECLGNIEEATGRAASLVKRLEHLNGS